VELGLEEYLKTPKITTVICVLIGTVIGAVLGVMAYYGQWLG